jgi:HlyD family secretion protein
MQGEAGGRQSTRGRLYLLENQRPQAVNVRLGITDGTMTELIVPPGSPQAAKLVEGAEVVTGTVTSAAANAPAARPPAGPRMSF